VASTGFHAQGEPVVGHRRYLSDGAGPIQAGTS